MTTIPKTDNITGASLTGSSGSANRTYTLVNSNISSEGFFIVLLDGSALQDGAGFTRSSAVVTFTVNVFDSQNISIHYFTTSSSTTSSTTTYATTLELARFMGIEGVLPDRSLTGESRNRENIGTGDNSLATYFLDHAYVLANSYTLEYGSDETSLTTLTETTHYTIDKSNGKISLTASGITALGTNILYGSYSYCIIGLTDVQLSDAIARAEIEIDRFTNNHFVDSSVSTPDWDQHLNEKQDGKGAFDRNYFTLQNYPLPDVSTTLDGAVVADDSTITVASTNGFPSSGSILVDGDKIEYTGKTSTTFTGCTSVGAHSDGDAVKAYVIEISTTSPGGTISWDVLKESTEFEINRSTGRVHIYSDGVDYFGTYVDIESSPLLRVANRFRVSYISGFSTIPAAVVKATLMLSSKDLMSLAVRKAHSSGFNDFNPSMLNIDRDEMNKILDNYRNQQYAKC